MQGKVKTFQQIADEYGIHRYTLRKRIFTNTSPTPNYKKTPQATTIAVKINI